MKRRWLGEEDKAFRGFTEGLWAERGLLYSLGPESRYYARYGNKRGFFLIHLQKGVY